MGEQTRTSTELTRKGSVEGRAVDNILLDTGCLRTLVHQEWVSRGRMLDGEAVAIRCAHEDTVLYLVALLQVVVGTRTMEVRAAVSETLPVDVLMGTDVPELPELLCTASSADVMSVMTRAQRRQMLTEEMDTYQKEQKSGATSAGVDKVDGWMSSLDDDLFGGGRTRTRQSRAQKRAERHAYAKDMAESDDPALADVQSEEDSHPLDISAEQLRTLQSTDSTLEAIRRAADGHPCSAGVGFFRRDGLLYRLWTPPGRDEEMTTEQLVLQCNVARQFSRLPMISHYQVIWERGRLLNASSRDFTGPHCTGMSQSIAALVKCARRHRNLGPGECHCHPCRWLRSHLAKSSWTLWDHCPKVVWERGMSWSFVIMPHGTPRLWH